MSQKNAKRLRRFENRIDMAERRMDSMERDIRFNTYDIANIKNPPAEDRRKEDRHRENVFFLAIFLMVLFALILTMKASAAVTGDSICKQLYVATHTSDISTTEEIRQVMQEADEIWP